MTDEHIEVIDISPAMAEEMLGHNTHNRNVRYRTVDAYARDMTAGAWQFTAEPIRFDTNGALIDGQHRLLAIVQSGVTIRAVVVRGLDPQTQDAVDTGIPRQFHDMLRLRGETNPARLAAIVRAVYIWEIGIRHQTSSIKPTNPELFATLEKYPDLRDISLSAGRVASHCAIPGSIIGLTWWLFDQLDSEDATYFFNRLASDTDHSKGHPIHELRRTTAESKASRGHRNRTWLTAVTIKAWNAYRDGPPFPALRYRAGGSKPDKFPEPR